MEGKSLGLILDKPDGKGTSGRGKKGRGEKALGREIL